ncbi:MAG TPA: gliding motility-associated C-terminal domain-containing protein, partial [Nitrosopumilaceae archaeon]|nr:gliding motility-associated C-terminal domain-containing protein [Nitrosopumilaceae archaeon]
NIMTPNGDGLNDLLIFKSLEFYADAHLTLFNRWGNKIYENSAYKNDWNGAGHVDGTYFYILQISGGETFKGFLLIVK